MVAPGAVDRRAHPGAPRAGEDRPRLGHHQGVAQRRSDVAGDLVGHGRFAPDHELLTVERVGKRAHEDGIHIGVDAAVLDQRIQAHEVGVVAIAILLGNEARVIPSFQDLRNEIDPCEREVRAYLIPENAEWQMMIVQVNPLGPEDAPAGLDRQVVQQVEGLRLFTETEDVMSDAGNSSHGQVW